MGKREIIYLSLHCHHQNDFCIKMSSDENHFNVSLIVRDKVTRLSTNHSCCFFRRERKAEAESNQGPSAYQPNALPLGQTGSHSGGDSVVLGVDTPTTIPSPTFWDLGPSQ